MYVFTHAYTYVYKLCVSYKCICMCICMCMYYASYTVRADGGAHTYACMFTYTCVHICTHVSHVYRISMCVYA